MSKDTKQKIQALLEEKKELKNKRKARTMLSFESFEKAQEFSRPITQRLIAIEDELRRLRAET